MKRTLTLLLLASFAICCKPEANPDSGKTDDNTPVVPKPEPEPEPEPEPDPEPEVKGQCIDAPLVLTLEAAPELGSEGVIAVCSSDGKEVDRIDLADLASVSIRPDGSMVPRAAINADAKFNTAMDALKSGSRYRVVHYTPLRIKDKSLIINLHNGVLNWEGSYYVTIDEGVIKGHKGIAKDEWRFTVKSKPSGNNLKVRPDGSGDFCTVQGALSYASSLGKDVEVTVDVGAGTYNEPLFLRDKNKVTIKGASSTGTVISYPNNESWCPGSGGSRSSRPVAGAAVSTSGGRSLMLVENCDALTISDLTLENSFGELKGQAEAIYFNSGSNQHRLTIDNCRLLSFQDTFLCKGVVWVHKSLIAGHCDFIWGYPKACLFEDCEIRARAAGYIVQARIQNASDKGFVFLNCKLTAEDGVKDGSMYLARSGGDSKVFDNVTFIDCSMSGVIASKGWYTSPAPTPSTPTATSGWKEYGSTDSAGKPLSGHSAQGKYLTAEEAAPYSSREAVLGW
ncbi:MAG: hypothetical protein J6X82_08000 [Bacteroidales bacterium]|nr:hypothetical protein [Bacteroidales bacterium]